MTERTFSIIKPDATRRNLTGAVNAVIEGAGGVMSPIAEDATNRRRQKTGDHEQAAEDDPEGLRSEKQSRRKAGDRDGTKALIGVLLLVVFAMVERQTESPLINVRIFENRTFDVQNIVLGVASMAFIPVFFFASVYSQVSLGYDANNAGLYLLVFFAGFAVFPGSAAHPLVS